MLMLKNSPRELKAWTLCVMMFLAMLLSGCTAVPPFDASLPRPDVKQISDEVRLEAVDGGADYYTRFTDSLPIDQDYFPIGVWLESVIDMPDIEKDLANGINTYVNLSDDSNPAQLEETGSKFLAPWPYKDSSGFVVSDEVDMWAGSGDGKWTGNFPGEGAICEPETARCGFTVQEELANRAASENILKYANYGKGVTFWANDEESSRFVNSYQDVVSADNYWFTDIGICNESEGGQKLDIPRDLMENECRLAANYGWTVSRLRSLVVPQGSKPVWGFVEVGHPASELEAPTITPPQIRAAVWHSIIAGARGIIYFNHSFNGSCVSHHVLRDCGSELSESVGKLNREVLDLAKVLNSPTVVNSARTSDALALMVKSVKNGLVLFAASSEHVHQQAEIKLSCSIDGIADVIGEGRTVKVVDGKLSDEFANGETVHIYEIPGNKCSF